MKTFRFLEFPVYQESKIYYKAVKQISVTLLQRNRSLHDQITRAALSVVLNIAEGSAKQSDKDFARFLETSVASMNEVVACIDIMQEESYISKEIKEKMIDKAEFIVKQLGGFIKKLRNG
jgi:four helix bundle protein